MSLFLDNIIAQKHKEIAAAASLLPVEGLKELALSLSEQKRDFMAAVKARPVNIIAEIKRASPSKGIINAGLNAAQTARAYQNGNAAAISVLTDGEFFKGSLADLAQARKNTNLPILRKDFTLSDYQIYEAAVHGADAVLLIVRILSDAQIEAYLKICQQLKLSALVEVYDRADALRVAKTEARLIGINNRNLATFETNVNHALEIAGLLNRYQTPVIASGITGPNDLKPYLAKGINTFLVGESLVKAKNTEQFLRELACCKI